MCGICGQINFDSSQPVENELIDRMCRVMAHRGPDDQGVYCNNNVALGHRRLSIIDLGSGHQPLCNEDGTVWIVFNGEIYNYVELRAFLEKKGHTFRTNSDTETIVHLYEEKGERFLEDLRGMFAIALWDERRKKLILAKDRVGKKPIYYAYAPGKFLIFASEIKAVLQNQEVKRDIEPEAIDQYLSFLYIPTPSSIFKAIKKLPAGHYLVCKDGRMVIKEYWDLIFHDSYHENPQFYTERFLEVLSEAVRIRLRSDVPLGAFLSGGIDSSAVVSLMAKMLERPVETLSIGFQEREYDETPYARTIAEIWNCNHTELYVKPDAANVLSKLVWHFDEPYADPSAVPTYYVSNMARKKVTVALSGDGGDETLGGYSRHFLERLEHRMRKLTDLLPSIVWSSLSDLMPYWLKGKNTIKNLSCRPDEAAVRKHYNLLFNKDLKDMLYAEPGEMNFDFDGWARDFYIRTTAKDPLDKGLYLDIKTYLTDDILVKVDRMSMANSLEVRSPLLDHKVLEFLATIPSSLKLKGRTTKYILKELLAKELPEEIISRKKTGFRLPIEVWLKKDLKNLVNDVIFSQEFKNRGYFNTDFIQQMWGDFNKGKKDYAHHIWQLFMLELWHREYADKGGPPQFGGGI